jgi:hypothetical protein
MFKPSSLLASLRSQFALLVVVWASSAAAQDAYVSAGFVKIPPQVELGAMSAVAVDREDRLYILHRGTPPLVVLDAKGEYQGGWGEKMFKVAHGLRIDAEGNVWTTDNGNHVLRKFSRTGELLATLGEVDKPGADQTHFRSPDDLVFSTKGEIFVADSGNGRILRLAADGKFIQQWGTRGKGEGQFATAHGLAIDPQDRIYVADRGNRRVQVFESGGKFVAEWGGFGNPFGLLVVGNELIASEGDIHKMFHLDMDGKIVRSWGGPKVLELPHFMAVDSKGLLYVAEVDGKRVQKFTRRDESKPEEPKKPDTTKKVSTKKKR